MKSDTPVEDEDEEAAKAKPTRKARGRAKKAAA